MDSGVLLNYKKKWNPAVCNNVVVIILSDISQAEKFYMIWFFHGLFKKLNSWKLKQVWLQETSESNKGERKIN